MVLDKFEELEFDGKKHKLCYPIKYVWEAERQLSDGNILILVVNATQGVPPTVHDMFIIIKYALMGGDTKLTEAQAEGLYLDAVNEKSLLEVFKSALEALKKSGVLGDPKKMEAAKA